MQMTLNRAISLLDTWTSFPFKSLFPREVFKQGLLLILRTNLLILRKQ